MHAGPGAIEHPNRVLLCGLIVRTAFRWGRIDPCREIVNDCGSRDVWPVFATTFSWGHEPSGTSGFGIAPVHDWFHELRHSDYFDRDFVERCWKPWVEEDTLIAHLRNRGSPGAILDVGPYGAVDQDHAPIGGSRRRRSGRPGVNAVPSGRYIAPAPAHHSRGDFAQTPKINVH